MKASDLFNAQIMDLPGTPEQNPLLQEWIFEEAELTDIRIDALHCTVGVLFEIRTSWLPHDLGDGTLNCGLMMLRNTTGVDWSAAPTGRPNPHVWAVNSCVVGFSPGQISLNFPLGIIGGMDLRLSAQSVEFHVGKQRDLPAQRPSYVDHIDVTGLVPGWDLDFTPTNGWYLEAP